MALAVRRTFTIYLLVWSGCAGLPDRAARAPDVVAQASGTDVLLVGLDALSDSVVWTSGTNGRVGRSLDGGASWHFVTVPGADTLQFRDVHGVDAMTAYVLSIGPGSASRIYRTSNGGATWVRLFENRLRGAFYDCFDFWPDGGGLVFSDAVDGAFPIVRSERGRVWEVLPPREQPEALDGEGGFAASGTCLVTLGEESAVIGTGNAATARVLRTSDRGRTWTSSSVPVGGGEAAGITTLAFRDAAFGVALGGDLTRPDVAQHSGAVTEDGGRTWRSAAAPTFPGAVYGAAFVPDSNVLLAAGPGGLAYSMDDARTWTTLDTLSYWNVDAAGPSAAWAVGPEGRIARIDFTGIKVSTP